MKTIKSFFFFAFASIFLFASCDKIDEALSKDINVKNIKFEVTTPIDDSSLRSTMLPFSGSATIDYNDPQLKDFKDYLSFVDKIEIDKVVIITTTEGDGSRVENLKLESTQAGVNYSIASYEFGEEYSDAQLITAAKNILNAVLNKKTVDLKVSGQSDETMVKNLKHQVWIKSGTVTVKLL